MNNRRSTRHLALGLTVVVAALLLLSTAGYSQQDRRDDRRRGGFDRQAMQARISAFMQERLGCTEAEWEVMAPMVERIRALQAEAGGSRGMMFRGRGGPGRRDEEREESAAAKASRELRELLEDEKAQAEAIKRKLDELRAARKAGQKKLGEAREELRSICTQRQEAEFVLMAVLD